MDILDKITINLKLDLPLAQQLREQITWLIVSDVLQAGDRLPAIRHLAQHLGINMNTVRSAYLKLEADGLVETRQGEKTRVLPLELSQIVRLSTSTRTDTIGVILPGLSNPFYHALLQGIQEIAHQYHTLLFVCDLQEDILVSGPRYFAQLLSKQVDGIIAISFNAPQFLDTATFPLVTVDWPGSAGCSVVMNLENAGYQATRHLLEHGHQRVGLITHALELAHTRLINAGYERALREAGLAVDPDLVAPVYGFGITEGIEGAQMLLNQAARPTAIFAITDLMALGAIQTIRQAGLRIPQDIALVGFNDIPLSVLVDPPLTTVTAPAREMGQEAMKMLHRLITGQQPECPQILLPTSLVVRASCGSHEPDP